MPNLNQIKRYLLIYPIIIALLISLPFSKYLVLNPHKNEFTISFFIYLILLFISLMSSFLIPSKNRNKDSFTSSLNHKELLTRTLFINLPLAFTFVFIFFTQNISQSLFYVLHLILFNFTYIILVVLYYRFCIKNGTFLYDFNKKVNEFTSNNSSSIERFDFIINTLNTEMVHLNDAYVIMRQTSYTQLLE